MATITRSRTRKPLAENALTSSASGGASKAGEHAYSTFSLMVQDDEGRFVRLEMSREEALRAAYNLLNSLSVKTSLNGWSTDAVRLQDAVALLKAEDAKRERHWVGI
jgi:hypothetical protein